MESKTSHRSSANYPLGTEKKESAKLLFQFFCNNLSLGRWEVAAACVKQLSLSADYREKIKAVLRDVIENPYGKSQGGNNLMSPHHLSWLCLSEYKNLVHGTVEARDLQFLIRDVEFRLLLTELTPAASSTVIKEIYQYHRHLRGYRSASFGSPTTSRHTEKYLSPSALTFLKSSLETQPAIGHAVISSLQARDQTGYRVQNETLQKLYIDSMLHSLDVLSKIESQSESLETNGVAEKLYTILSLFDPEPSLNHKHVTTLISKLIQQCTDNKRSLDRCRLLSCVVGRKDNYLINLFVKSDNEWQRQQVTHDGILQEMDDCRQIHSDLVSMSMCAERDRAWRMFLVTVLEQRQHFLDQIVRTALGFIQTQKFEELEKLFTPEELGPLKPLVVLIGWNHCYTSSNARHLLSVLWDEKIISKSGALDRSCNKLAYQLDLIEWCLDKTRLRDECKSATSGQKSTDLFRTLESHSVLYVLHHAAKLSSLNETEVLSLLEKTPNHTETMNGNLNKRVVRFADQNKDSSDLDSSQPVSLEQERDISIYRCYCALKNVMFAIKICMDYAHLELMNPTQKTVRRKSSCTSFNSTVRHSSQSDLGDQTLTFDVNFDLSDVAQFQEFYNKNVWSKLEAAKEHLSEVFPLTFRLEMLENIFSLLFLTHKDIQESLQSDSESGETGAEENKQSLNSDHLNATHTLSDDDSPQKNREEMSHIQRYTFPQSGESHLSNLNFDEPFESIYHSDIKFKDYTKEQTQNEDSRINEVSTRPGFRPVKLGEEFQQLCSKSPVVDSGQQISGTSTLSTGSVQSLFKLGFMANEYVVRDVLKVLRDSLFEMNTAKFRLAGKDRDNSASDKNLVTLKFDSETEECLTKVVPCSVTPETLQKRISRLTQFVSEAQWRYQLVTHSDLPKQAGQVLTEKIQPQSYSSDEDYYERSHVTEKRRIRRVTKSGTNYSDETGGGETTASQYTDGGYDSSRQRRSRSSSRRKSIGTSRVMKQNSGIVPSMLSSPESLLCLCMKRNQIAQANQVVKMFNMDGRTEIAEVSFSSQYSEAVRKLHSFGSKSGRDMSSAAGKPGRVSMKILANVAAAAMATASVSSITDELLSSAPLPVLSAPKNLESLPVQLREFFSDVNVPCFIIGDLSITACRTWDLCCNLLEIVKNSEVKVTVTGKPEIKPAQDKMTSRECKPMGCVAFLDQLRELVQFALNWQSPESTTADQILMRKVIGCNPESSLRLSTHPITTSSCRNLLAAIEVLKKIVEKAQGVLAGKSVSPKPTREKTSPESSLGHLHGSPQTYSKQEQPVIHNAMKHLIHALEKHTPQGGFIVHFIRNLTDNVPATRNYLLSLYDHVKELAFLVAECEAKTKDSVVVPTNYFRMLDEGPISTLGRLMFVKKMQPARLEKVAQKLSLNLTHIIVRSCCPKVPSKHVKEVLPHQIGEVHHTSDGRVILNDGVQWPTPARCPEILVRSLLSKLIQLIRDVSQRNNARGVFTSACAELLVQTTEYEEFSGSTQELQFVHLDELKSREDKICFYGNLQNLLTLHSYLFYTLKYIHDQDHRDGMTVLDKVLQSSCVAYHVGELGVVSLFELKYVINRCGLHPPAVFNKLLRNRLYALDPVDPWFRYVPAPEPRLLFVTTDITVSSPPIQILSPDMVQSQLHQAMKDYLNLTVSIHLQKKQVTIPQLLVWYRRDFSSEKVDQFDAPNEGLVNFISTQVTGATESDLIELLQLDQVHDFGENIDSTGRKELPFHVKVQQYNHDYQLNLDFESFKRDSHPLVRTHRRSTSLPLSMESSENLSLDKEKEPSTYQMTPITLEYVKEDSPLCATLVSLICSDELDDIEEHLEDDYFAESSHRLRKRTQSDISLVDIRSYRYHRLTDDYPILKRHLLNLVVPLAAAEDPDIVKSGDPMLKFVTSSISDKVKGCMLNLHSNKEYQMCLSAILNQLFSARDWRALRHILICIPKMQLEDSPQLKVLSDFVVCCLANSLAKSKSACTATESEMICRSLRLCHDTEHQARLSLALVRHLPLDSAIRLLQFCLSRQSVTLALRNALSVKQEELHIYKKISQCADLRIKAAVDIAQSVLPLVNQVAEDTDSLKQYLDWRNVQLMKPGEVLNLLIQARDFDTARAWATLHNIAESKYQEIEQKFIHSLLSQSPPNTTRAFKSLESILKTNEDACYSTCQHLLGVVKETSNLLFLTNFVLSQLIHKMSDTALDEYRCVNMGAKCLLSLPESIRGEYEHLIKMPKLILEQLLMNMKADLAGQVFCRIKQDLNKVKDSRLGLSTEEFDEQLSKYGSKAIEFPVVQVTQDQDQNPSRSSPHTADTDSTSLPKSAFLDSVRVGSSRRSVDYSGLNVNRPLLSSSLGVSPNRRAFSPPTARSLAQKFVMPADPPPKDKWVPDSAVSICMVCQVERFSMFNRRHHCRRCGRVVCASCSTKTSTIVGVSSRTCDECYEQIFKPRLDVIKNDQDQRRESLALSVSPLNRAPPVSSADSSIMGQELSAPDWNISSVIRHTEHEWKLKTEEHFNIYTREEFYYEQAPSASLCISILTMMSSQSKAGQIMLQLCDELSKTLRPIAPGVPNPEVDYSLVISMMKHLLFRAKMIYIQSGESHGLGMCDTYLSRVDLLNLLVSGNVSDIPSIQELTKVESVSRLRDRFIEDERFPLAMEVSTKCGLDTSGVWGAWGMACLHCADYSGAREKFNRCLKAPLDRNKSQQTSKLLIDIIDCLETMPSTGNTDVKSILSSLGSIKSLINMHPLRYVDESLLDKAQFDEAVYYLRTFGSHMSTVQFYHRHGYLMKAAQYILDHKCSTEVFVEGLLMPSLTQEDLGKLEDQLTLIDPSLEKWSPYLTASCRHLMKSKLMHVLYHIQIYMKDYIRAAMNCITYFYQRGARTYLDLAGRVKYLFEAQKHLDAYLDPSKWGSVRPPVYTSPKPSWTESASSESSSSRLIQTPQEVKRYLNSVIIQIEVTKYMEKSMTAKPPDGTAIAVIQSYLTHKEPPPTLFGNANVRADVVTMVLMVGEDLLTSFDLSMKIIREYRLSALPILKHTAHEMAKFHDYPRIHQLLGCMKNAGMDDDQSVDEIIGACIIILKDDPAEAKEVDGFIKLLRLDSNKINAMILVGKLKSAYLLAVKSERVEDVQRISGAAQRSGQTSVRNICDKWLNQRLKKL